MKAIYHDRPKNAHALARREADAGGGLVVYARTVVQHHEGISIDETLFSEADAADTALTTFVSCPCGTVYILDVTAFMRGERRLSRVSMDEWEIPARRMR